MYLGEADKANGISTKVPGAINLVASNLDALAAVLLSAGKAAFAYEVINLAQSFIAGIPVTVSNTAVTDAQHRRGSRECGDRFEASAASSGAAGRLAGTLGTLKLAAPALVVTKGDWLGEGVGSWVGYGKTMDEAEAATRREAEAARDAAAAKAALAQRLQLAVERAMGLTVESKKLVDGFRQQGESTAKALEKLQKPCGSTT